MWYIFQGLANIKGPLPGTKEGLETEHREGDYYLEL